VIDELFQNGKTDPRENARQKALRILATHTLPELPQTVIDRVEHPLRTYASNAKLVAANRLQAEGQSVNS
jgi:hypothetical protein